MAGLRVPLSTLRRWPYDHRRMTRGPDDWLGLSGVTLSSTTPCRFGTGALVHLPWRGGATGAPLREASCRPRRCATSAKKYSALDAAALVLRESGQPMSCPELIAQMAAKGYWTSPKGKTPASTLYAALAREAKLKGKESRFQKIGPGRFAYRGDAERS